MDYLLQHLLQTSADLHPDRVAVVDGSRSATYGDLEADSNRLANLLLELGVERGDRVGIYIDKSIESLVGIYGVLKAGAIYVPFDPHAPASRLAFIANNCGMRVLITGSEKSGMWSELTTQGAPFRTLVVPDATDDALDTDSLDARVITSAPLGLREIRRE
jgi:acyl-CoA synthetase (AMP-forming)/AMP-acid ligase II